MSDEITLERKLADAQANVASVEQSKADLERDAKSADKAYRDAFKSGDADATFQAALARQTAIDALDGLPAAIDRANAVVANLQRQIRARDHEAIMARVLGTFAGVLDGVRGSLTPDMMAELASDHVTGFALTWPFGGTHTLTPTWEDGYGPPKHARSTPRVSGARSRVSYVSPSGETYTSRQLVETFGADVLGADVAAKVLSNGVGLTHRADAISTTKGFTKTS